MKRSLLAVAAAIGMLAGCSGGGSAGSPGSAIITPQAQKVAFVVKIPVTSTGTSNAVRKPSYVPTNTASVTFEVSTNGGSSYGSPQSVNIDISNSTQCPQSGGFYNCSAYFDAPIGTITLRVKAWDAAGGTGNVLSEAIIASQTIVEGADNAVSVTLDGVVATLTLALSDSIAAGTASSFTATVGGKDASGNTILVPPGKLVDATDNLLSPTLTPGASASDFTVHTYDTTDNTFAVDYNGDTPISGPITFTVSQSGMTSGTHDLSVTALPALTVSTNALQFLDTTNTKTVTIGESGYGTGTFTITPSGCTGIATAPATATAASGSATITVTPVAVGTGCTLKITDSYSQEQDVTVTVTASHGVIQ